MKVCNLRGLCPKSAGKAADVAFAACLCPCQDIGESETHELEALYRPLLDELLQAVLSKADLSSQGVQLEGLDLKQLVRCTQHTQYWLAWQHACCSTVIQLLHAGHRLSTGWALWSAKACLHGM
jgi:hypothetical protein